MDYKWDFLIVLKNIDPLISGLYGTLLLSSVSLILGLITGLILALLRLSKFKPVNVFALYFIEIFRCTPPLVQLYWIFYALPILINISLGPFESAIIALSLGSGAYFAEIFRGGIVSIARGQWEAGKSLGMSYFTLMLRIILPQAIKRMLPAFVNRAVELVKTTPLVAVIGYSDLLYQTVLLSQRSYRSLEYFTFAALIYFVILSIGTTLSQYFENKFNN